MGKSKELAELGDVFTQTSGRVGVNVPNSSYDFYVKQRGNSYSFGLEADTDDTRLLMGEFNSQWRIAATYGSNGSFMPFAFYTSDVERVVIDTAGRMTLPYQPAFQAYADSGGNQHFSGSTNPYFSSTVTNTGNHFNGTTFTAPVAGKYLFSYSILTGTAGDYGLIALHVNGVSPVGSQNWTQCYVNTTNDQTVSSTQVLTLSANDQVNLFLHPNYINFYWSGNYSKFSGYLLG